MGLQVTMTDTSVSKYGKFHVGHLCLYLNVDNVNRNPTKRKLMLEFLFFSSAVTTWLIICPVTVMSSALHFWEISEQKH
jgi:hypothetical protein